MNWMSFKRGQFREVLKIQLPASRGDPDVGGVEFDPETIFDPPNRTFFSVVFEPLGIGETDRSCRRWKYDHGHPTATTFSVGGGGEPRFGVERLGARRARGTRREKY